MRTDCFAYSGISRKCIRLLAGSRCNNCVFYKSKEQHEADKRKATARIKSLNKATQAYIIGKYHKKWESRNYEGL